MTPRQARMLHAVLTEGFLLFVDQRADFGIGAELNQKKLIFPWGGNEWRPDAGIAELHRAGLINMAKLEEMGR